MKRLLRNLRDSEDGQAVLELALVLPVLLILVFGIIDLGRAVNYWNDETHVAEVAARYAAVGTLPTSGPCANKPNLTELIKCEATADSGELANGSASAYGDQKPSIGVEVCIPKDEAGQPVTVKVHATYAWLPELGHLASTALTGSATMRLEQTIPQAELAKFATTGAAC